MNPTADSEARLIVFLFESPEPFMLPDRTAFTFILDERLPWLSGVEHRQFEHADPLPDEARDQLFVSFRFWRSAKHTEVPLPSEALMDVLKRVMPSDKTSATRIGHIGLEGEEALDRLREVVSDVSADDRELATELEHDVTIVEAVTVLLPSRLGASPVAEALERSMESLAEFSRVYRLSNRLRMQTVTHERLAPGGVFWTTRKLFDPTGTEWDEGLELLAFPLRMPGKTQHDELDEPAMQRLGAYFERYRGGHPLVAYSERGLKRALFLMTSVITSTALSKCKQP